MKKKLICLKLDNTFIHVIKKDIWKQQKEDLKNIKKNIIIKWNAFEKMSFKNGKELLRNIEVSKIKKEEAKKLNVNEFFINSIIFKSTLSDKEIIIDYQNLFEGDDNFFFHTALHTMNHLCLSDTTIEQKMIDITKERISKPIVVIDNTKKDCDLTQEPIYIPFFALQNHIATFGILSQKSNEEQESFFREIFTRLRKFNSSLSVINQTL